MGISIRLLLFQAKEEEKKRSQIFALNWKYAWGMGERRCRHWQSVYFRIGASRDAVYWPFHFSSNNNFIMLSRIMQRMGLETRATSVWQLKWFLFSFAVNKGDWWRSNSCARMVGPRSGREHFGWLPFTEVSRWTCQIWFTVNTMVTRKTNLCVRRWQLTTAGWRAHLVRLENARNWKLYSPTSFCFVLNAIVRNFLIVLIGDYENNKSLSIDFREDSEIDVIL